MSRRVESRCGIAPNANGPGSSKLCCGAASASTSLTSRKGYLPGTQTQTCGEIVMLPVVKRLLFDVRPSRTVLTHPHKVAQLWQTIHGPTGSPRPILQRAAMKPIKHGEP